MDEGAEGAEVAKDTLHAPVSHQPQKRNISRPNTPPAKVKKAKAGARASTSSHPQTGISSRTRHQGGGHITTNDTEPGAQITRNDTQIYEPKGEGAFTRAFDANASVNQAAPMNSDDDEDAGHVSTKGVQPRRARQLAF